MEIIIVIAAALILALIVCLIMKSGHNTATGERCADAYIKDFRITGRQDIFLHSTITKTPRPQNDNKK